MTASPTPVAAVDCGTNSIRLLIVRPDADGGRSELARATDIVRLGQGVDATGTFHPDALARTFRVVETYASRIADAGVPTDRIHFVATSASRDVANREEFFAGVRQRLGVLPDVISGAEEARLSFAGALSGVDVAAEPVLVMDLGGGSTELVVGTASGEIHHTVSLDVGSVRLTERFLHANPVSPTGLAAAAEYVDDLLAGSGVDFGAVRTWIGVAGTVTTLAGVSLLLPVYDRSKVHRCVLPAAEIERLLGLLAASSLGEIKALPSMHPQRADVITGGALVVSRVARAAAVGELVVSESDILDGIALDLLEAGAAD